MKNVNQEDLKVASTKLRALSNVTRIKILNYLHKNPNSKVGDVYRYLRLEQSQTSVHLGILKKSGFVRLQKSEKSGREKKTNINVARTRAAIRSVKRFLNQK